MMLTLWDVKNQIQQKLKSNSSNIILTNINIRAINSSTTEIGKIGNSDYTEN